MVSKKGGYHNGKLTLDLFYSRMFIKAYAMGYYYHAQWSNPEWKSGKLCDRSSDWHYFSFVLQIIETKAKCLTNRAIICKKYRVPPYGLLTAKCWGEAISSIYLVWDEKIFIFFFHFLEIPSIARVSSFNFPFFPLP